MCDILEDRKGIHTGMTVLHQRDVEGKRERGKRAARFRHDRRDLDRPLKMFDTPPGKRGIANIQEPQRCFRRDSPRPRPLQRACQHQRQLGQERLVVDDVVVCPGAELGKRSSCALGRDDDDRCGQPEAPKVFHERGAALILRASFEDQRCDIRVVADPAQSRGHRLGPAQLEIRGDIAKCERSVLRGAALVCYIQDFHGACRELSRSSIGRTSSNMQPGTAPASGTYRQGQSPSPKPAFVPPQLSG